MTGPTDDHIQKRGAVEQGPQDPGGDLPHALATGFLQRPGRPLSRQAHDLSVEASIVAFGARHARTNLIANWASS